MNTPSPPYPWDLHWYCIDSERAAAGHERRRRQVAFLTQGAALYGAPDPRPVLDADGRFLGWMSRPKGLAHVRGVTRNGRTWFRSTVQADHEGWVSYPGASCREIAGPGCVLLVDDVAAFSERQDGLVPASWVSVAFMVQIPGVRIMPHRMTP